MAQDLKDGEIRPIGYYIGVESTEGTLDPATGIHYGNTVVLNSISEWNTSSLTVSVDYSTNQFVPDNFIVTGGSWSLAIFQNGNYLGTVYGKVSSGTVRLATNAQGASIQLTEVNLQPTGGLAEYEGKKFEDITGAFTATTDLRSSHSEGNISFNF